MIALSGGRDVGFSVVNPDVRSLKRFPTQFGLPADCWCTRHFSFLLRDTSWQQQQLFTAEMASGQWRQRRDHR